MRILHACRPEPVFRYFESICAVAHGSGNTRQLQEFCLRFARERAFDCRGDVAGNVVIRKPASPGREHEPALLLQAHLDMVCQSDADCPVDLRLRGPEPVLDGDWVRARGTTLGADDGIGVALILALLDDEELSHPALEAVFTTEEETGMDGAQALEVSDLTARRMINLDSEEEGILTVSCAGGATVQALLPVRRQAMDAALLRVQVAGLRGGHSGMEIDKGRQSANTLLARLLDLLTGCAPFRLVELAGGTRDNVIPCSGTAVLACAPADAQALLQAAQSVAKTFHAELADIEPNLSVFAGQTGEGSVRALTEEDTRRVICALLNAPQGVQVMSCRIEGLVQTSLNLGILTLTPEQLQATFCVRSSVESQKQMLVRRLANLFEMLGGSVRVQADYPGWEYRPESALRERIAAVYEELFGTAPQIAAIHAGLECGFFAAKFPGLDAVSLGPEMQEVHTTRERLSVRSTERTWQLLRRVIGEPLL